MHRQSMDLGDPRVDRLIEVCEVGLKRVLQTKASDVYLYACNGHGAWEAAIANLIAPGKSALVPGIGHFSESWAVQTEGLGHKVVRTPIHDGYPIDIQAVEQALRADSRHEIAAVFFVQTDTAGAITSDLRAIRAAIDASGHPALLVADVVASLAAAPFAMDDMGVDVAVGASQKGLMLPPGLGFVAVNARADEVAQANPAPRFYWDWRRRKSEFGYRKFCGTAPLHLLMGLQAALDLLQAEGLDNVLARHRRIATAVQAAVGCWSEKGALQFYCKVPQARSVSVTAVQTSAGIDPEAIRRVAREQFQVAMAGGLGHLTGRVFRIGHLGDMNEPMILGCLAGIQAALGVLRVPYGGGALDQAVAVLREGAQS
jgi:alanine-glyoxylate transaminase/serine-glyoxylate transaminase/serine-pyruvate transaminase